MTDHWRESVRLVEVTAPQPRSEASVHSVIVAGGSRKGVGEESEFAFPHQEISFLKAGKSWRITGDWNWGATRARNTRSLK